MLAQWIEYGLFSKSLDIRWYLTTKILPSILDICCYSLWQSFDHFTQVCIDENVFLKFRSWLLLNLNFSIRRNILKWRIALCIFWPVELRFGLINQYAPFERSYLESTSDIFPVCEQCCTFLYVCGRTYKMDYRLTLSDILPALDTVTRCTYASVAEVHFHTSIWVIVIECWRQKHWFGRIKITISACIEKNEETGV